MKLLHSISNFSMSALGNTALALVACGMAACGIGLTALYLITYVQETPATKSLQCMIGVERSDCPRYGAEMDVLKGKLHDLAEKTTQAEGKLANLRAVETAVNEVTLFTMHDDPNSAFTVTVGTKYTRLVEPESSPAYFCYIGLNRGSANEERNLSIQDVSGPIHLDAESLRKAGVSSETLAFGRSVCKPFLIGGQK